MSEPRNPDPRDEPPADPGLRARPERLENIEDEMTQSYMDYAMSVIIGRALPDVRDGLKPVQRRVLYAMLRERLLSSRPYSKCAGIVGEVLKKYHPHGDASVYDTLVRLAQDFNLRHPLIDGKGNFGSVDGDPPAAYRYTEARLTPFAEAMMEDIDRNTVDFSPNFDNQHVEPRVLPTVVPSLLVNGSDGIAVGMATKIPPHNLGEVARALLHLIEHSDSSDAELTAELLQIVPGPDFPTGGRIHGRKGIESAYREGRGVIQVRAVADFETTREGRDRIVVSEIPYQVNKARLIEKIAELVRDKRLTGISDLRDESDRRGMRIVIELKRGEEPRVVLNNLYRHTALQSSFGMNLLAISRNRPRTFSLVGMLREFLQFRRQVIRRRTRFDLDRAEARLHILEGLAGAVDRLDEVIEWIRTSKDTETARARLMERLQPRRLAIDRELLRRSGNGRAPAEDAEGDRLSERQARAILELRLQRLTRMERERIEAEMSELGAEIERLRQLLASPKAIDRVVRDEAAAAAKKHADERRTEIVEAASDLGIEALIPVEDTVISVTQAGYNQADAAQRLPRPGARRDRSRRRRDSRRRCDPRPPDREHAQPDPLPHRRRRGVPAEGLRDPRGREGGPGPRDREPAPPLRGAAGRRGRPAARRRRRARFARSPDRDEARPREAHRVLAVPAPALGRPPGGRDPGGRFAARRHVGEPDERGRAGDPERSGDSLSNG